MGHRQVGQGRVRQGQVGHRQVGHRQVGQGRVRQGQVGQGCGGAVAVGVSVRDVGEEGGRPTCLRFIGMDGYCGHTTQDVDATF